eukprot:jgi/Bigna1/139277/aug1.49_g13985
MGSEDRSNEDSTVDQKGGAGFSDLEAERNANGGAISSYKSQPSDNTGLHPRFPQRAATQDRDGAKAAAAPNQSEKAAKVERWTLLVVLKSMFFVSLYIGSSIGLIFYNKWLLAGTFPHPVLLTLWHMVIAVVLTQIMKVIGPLRPLVVSETSLTAKQVAFIQMLKASQILVMLFLSFVAGIVKPSCVLVLIVTMVVLGVCATVVGELKINTIGIMLQATAILSEGARLVLVNLLLSSNGIRLKPLQALHYFAPACAVCLAVSGNSAYSDERAADVPDGVLGCLRIVADEMGRHLQGSSVWMHWRRKKKKKKKRYTDFDHDDNDDDESYSNVMILALAGIVKDVLIVIGSCFVFATVITNLQYVGYVVALSGVFAYKLYTSAALRLAFMDLFESARGLCCHPSSQPQRKSPESAKRLLDDSEQDEAVEQGGNGASVLSKEELFQAEKIAAAASIKHSSAVPPS